MRNKGPHTLRNSEPIIKKSHRIFLRSFGRVRVAPRMREWNLAQDRGFRDTIGLGPFRDHIEDLEFVVAETFQAFKIQHESSGDILFLDALSDF